MSDNVETPTQKIVKAANQVLSVTDSLGRVLNYKQHGALDRMNCIAAAGPELSRNTMWMQYALAATMCTAIDGVPVPKPNRRQDIEALVNKLGEEGLNAIIEAIAPPEPEADPA